MRYDFEVVNEGNNQSFPSIFYSFLKKDNQKNNILQLHLTEWRTYPTILYETPAVWCIMTSTIHLSFHTDFPISDYYSQIVSP